MIVSTCQPYFAPYPGFFSKILRSDAVVVMDAVQFPLGTTWLTRNRFKGHQGTLWMSVPVWKKGRGLQIIGDVKICYDGQWARKYLTSLKTVYKHAPFFEDHVPFLENIFSKNFERLLDLNIAIISYLMKHLDISTEMLLLSELDIETKEPQLTVEICKKIGASHFMAQRSAGKYLDQEALQNERIKLELFTPRSVTYPQLWGPFIPNLSSFDLLFTCGPGARDILAKV
jgi:hypothetical protein